VDKIFSNMDRDKDAKLTYDEFVEGSKQDPTIVQVRTADRTASASPDHVFPRPCLYTMALCDTLACAIDYSVAYSAARRLSFDCSVFCPGGTERFPSSCAVVILSLIFTNRTRILSSHLHEHVQGLLLSRKDCCTWRMHGR